MKRVNIVIGRFQPFTKGHYACVKEAMKVKGVPTVICMIDVPPEKVDKRHPFTSELLLDVYSDLFAGDINIADVITVKSADIVLISKTLALRGYKIVSWTCGTDRLATYTRMSTKYHDMADLSDDFEMIEVPRTDEDISATKARQCLLNDDVDGFFALVPAGANLELFNILKEQIDKVYKFESLNRRVLRLEKLLYKL